MLGIIGAMDIEIQELKKQMLQPEITAFGNMNFYKGSINNKKVVVVKCGIGKVNAAMCTQILIDKFRVSAIVNTGVAGGLNKNINICDIVISTTAQEHDMDVTPLGYKKGIIPDLNTSEFEANKELIRLAEDAGTSSSLDVKIIKGKIVSGDQFISSHEVKERLKNDFKGDCAEMEGAAIAHVAYLNNIPFLIIRAISDKADGSAEMDYPTFEKKAAINSHILINEIIKKYND